MADLDQFRAETRAWLEANCPPEMRTPMRSEKDACWGGRKFVFQSPAQKHWRRRAERGGDQDPQGGNGGDRRA
jgi:acyl-CoA dehydrogenase